MPCHMRKSQSISKDNDYDKSWPSFCGMHLFQVTFVDRVTSFKITNLGASQYTKLQTVRRHLISIGIPIVNTLRPRQNGCLFADDTFKRIFLNANVRIPIKISLKFVPKGPINNIPALVQIMAWRHPGAKPLSEPMMVSLLTHICVTRPQWVKMRLSDL